MKTSAVLRGAGDLLREGGWCQGDYSKAGKHCTVGAVGTGSHDFAIAEGLLDSLVDDGEPGATLRWNDRTCKSAEEAEQLLDAAYVLALQIEGIEPEDVL